MRIETTPPTISIQIIDLCSTIAPKSEPIFIPTKPMSWAIINECFNNVNKIVASDGGRSIQGWMINQFANILIEAEAHAIWEKPNHELVDISPHEYSEKQILFLPDRHLKYTGDIIPNHRQALTKSPLVAEFIDLSNKRDEIAKNSYGHSYALPKPMVERIVELLRLFKGQANRNDLCPCGSGLKFKKCCGLYEI